MKLLLDEMWSPEIARQLRNRGHDVIAVVEQPELRGRADAEIVAVAQNEERALVTDNVADFRPLAIEAVQQGRLHFGLVFTTNNRFPRHDNRTIGRLVHVLGAFLTSNRDLRNDEYWLE